MLVHFGFCLTIMKDKIFTSFGYSEIGQHLPNLIEIQTKSFERFLKHDLAEIFSEVSPIKDWGGKELEIHIADFYFDEPKYTEAEAKNQNASFEVPLRVKLKVVNKKNNYSREQEIYFGEFPLMTKRGTFIVNGVERVVVSQLIRSAGIFFFAQRAHNRNLFGAKIIPNRGAWLEFETEQDNVIYVKIDRKRKVPVTALLKAFGMEDNEKIKKIFSDVDTNADVKFIDETIKKDVSKKRDEGFLEIYKRLRPGDLATFENARQLIESMFFNFERYDLSEVGRWKLNQRLSKPLPNLPVVRNERLLTMDDLVTIIKEIIKMNNDPNAQPDDIDHLTNRRVRTVGELLQNKLRIAMSRIERTAKERMTTTDLTAVLPSQLVNIRPFIAAIKEFFTTSQLSQFMDQVNPLAELEHKRRISAMGPGGLSKERAGFEVRDVHPTYYGRICPIQTPEGPNIGLVGHLASHARLNDFGFLETPYFKVKNGKITKEVVWLDAFEEQKVNIAHSGTSVDSKGNILEDKIESRVKGRPSVTKKEKIDYIDIAPQQFISVATAMIPFLEHDDANRALMGSNMQRQAISCIRPQAPLVGTGMEKEAGKDSGQLTISEINGEVVEVDARHIVIEKEGASSRKEGWVSYPLHNFTRTNQFTSITQHPLVKKGDKVKKGVILADGAATDNGRIALGQNLVVVFMPWRGANFEDAIIISEKLVKDDRYTSIHIEDFTCDVRETKLGPEITTPDIPNVGEDKLRNLDEEGVIRIGAEVMPGDILVGKVSPKGEADLTAEERLLRAIFGEKAHDVKDTSLLLPHGKRGRVIGVKVFSRDQGNKLPAGVIKSIRIDVAQLRKVMVGDKMAGRHGNKGVISKVLPAEEMPYLEDGTPVDIILNPLGVASRMNIGQILETHLGWAASKLGFRAITPALSGATEQEIRGALKEAGLPEDGKVDLYDGRTGELFKSKVTVGIIYMMKLNHLVEDKIHMRSIGPYSLITQQPLGGKAQFGGQRFGEMEVWALEGYGAAYTLQEMLTIKSDDVVGRTNAYDSIIRGQEIRTPNVPASFDVLVREIKALGLDIDTIGGKENDDSAGKCSMSKVSDFKSIKLKLASPEEILRWSHGEVVKPETINYRTQKPEKDGLFSEQVFGPEKDWECYCGKYRRVRYKGIVCDKCGVEVTRALVRRERMGHIKLAVPVSHIWFLRGVPSKIGLALGLSVHDLEKVIYFASYIITKVDQEAQKQVLSDLDKEFKTKLKVVATDEEKHQLRMQKEKIATILRGLSPMQIITENEYQDLSYKYAQVFEAGIGAEAIRKLLETVDFKKLKKELTVKFEDIKEGVARQKIIKRLRVLEAMEKAGIRPEWMILTILPVLPPDLRPMVALDGGRYATSDLNDLYRRVINRNNRLKKLLDLNAPEVIVRNEKRMLQESVDALIDNSARRGQGPVMASTGQKRTLKSLADMLKGKQGRFRQNLLGKRVDYSGRSVIVVGPNLKLGQCGLPKHMALELFKPFVISKLVERELVHNIRGAGRLIEQGSDEVWAILEEVIVDKYVLLNRAPTLHRLGIQAFQPVLIEGSAIQVHPIVCKAFNADFDGDQMAVHLPLTQRAQAEARNIMLASKNLLKPATGDPIAVPTQDIILGCFWLTKIIDGLNGEGRFYSSHDNAILDYYMGRVDLRAKVNLRIKIGEKMGTMETSVGRIIFNAALPDEIEFVNKLMGKKDLLYLSGQLISTLGNDGTAVVLDKIKDVGNEYATISGISWGMDDLSVPETKKEIMEKAEKEVEQIHQQYLEGLLTWEERYSRIIEIWYRVTDQIAEEVKKILDPLGSVYDMVVSGARASFGQLSQIMGLKGMVVNPAGEIIELPIKSSFKEGFNPLEYFISTHGARKGTTDTALRTATAGYLTRRLVDVSQDVIVRSDDCKDKDGIYVYREDGQEYGRSLASRIFSRVILEDIKEGNKVIAKKGDLLDKNVAEAIDNTGIGKVKVRSVLSCKATEGVCQKCYGFDLSNNELVQKGALVGIVTAQAIGEPGTQLTMRTFHFGGVAGGSDITQGLLRVEEIFECRLPKGRAPLAEIDGKVVEITETEKERIIRIKPTTKPKMPTGKEDLDEQPKTEYSVSANIGLWVKEGEEVKVGQQLAEGHLNLKEIFKFAGKEAVIRYIIRDVQNIYTAQGEGIHDKHVELIVRQMFSRIRVDDPGETNLLIGDIVEKQRYVIENNLAKKSGKQPAKVTQLLMGVSKVAITTESWLSAASFQETSKILINAAIEGKKDNLRGLKENVIIGKLIPAGTAFEVDQSDEESSE